MKPRASTVARLTLCPAGHTLSGMTPLAQAVVLICVVALTAALVVVLLALRRVFVRTEAVLDVVERQVSPLTAQVGALSEDARKLTQETTLNMEHAGAVIRRAEEVTDKVSTLVGAVNTVTRAGQVVTLVAGLKKGLSVFASNLRDKHD
jgi:uncharacterized protein YoxC